MLKRAPVNDEACELAEKIRPEAEAAEKARIEALSPVRVGDLVVLGPGADREYRSCPAVVTKIAEAHCTVVVLDSTQQYGIGECWPMYSDVTLTSDALRIGTHVIISGMVGAKTKRMNGLTGHISAHPNPQEGQPAGGHPLFIRNSLRDGQLAVCVVF